MLFQKKQQRIEHRVFILEDTRELQCKAPNTVYLRTSDTMDMQKLLKKHNEGERPDRINTCW